MIIGIIEKNGETMRHEEITSQFKVILKIYRDFKKFESTVSGHAEHRDKMHFEHYIQQILKFNKQSGGTLIEDIYAVTIRLGSAKPDFKVNGLSAAHMERYSQATKGRSERMEAQLELAKILEIKDLFKNEMDIFKPQNITRVEDLLKELK